MKGWHLTVFLVVVLVGCGETVNVKVDCVTTAEQDRGKTAVEVCWDFSATCENGVVVKAAHTCQKIKDGATETVTISADKLTDVDKCAGSKPPTAKLENLTLNGKPPA